ncbi:ATP-binding protein [Streptomyces sp. JJ66]|uniref:ATP-binding protein n=1 Tax=Streptomyces sp. JJ66 TaxID=2803843 RepID=UPI001C58CECA|nr:ATP-binding protein [Streptomyces sp. JJ66]
MSVTPKTTTATEVTRVVGHIRSGVYSTSFERSGCHVAHARQIGAVRLRQCGLNDEDAIETVRLLISELVTNAVVHGAGEMVRFRLALANGHVRIEVADDSPARARVKRAGADDEGGRGMLLVQALAESWGTSDDGTRTWCVVRVGKDEP